MYKFAAAQQTSTVKLPLFFFRFQCNDRFPRVNKSKITSKNTFDRYHFDFKGNHELGKKKKNFLLGFLPDL